jgi:hypothetical protein
MKVIALLVLALIEVQAHSQSSQSLPEAPNLHFNKTEWTLLATDAATRSLDVYSTHWALSVGNREATLPRWIANHPPVMVIYSGGIVGAQYYVARKLFQHHLRRWAYAITATDITIDAPVAIHNLFMPVCTGPYTATASGCQVSYQTSPTVPPIPIPDIISR